MMHHNMPVLPRLLLLAAAWTAVLAQQGSAATKASIHTVVPVECTHGYFEWQVLGLAYSMKRAGQPGPLTRLMSCNEEQLAGYKWLDLMPTYVAPNMAFDAAHNDWYQPYNKPTAIEAWLRDVQPEEDYIMIIDADSILRLPFIPERHKVERGWGYSPYYVEILEGVNNALSAKHIPGVAPRQDWLAGPNGRRADKVGPPYVLHKEDLRAIAPLWYHYTYAVRNDPEAWNLTGDGSIKEYGGKTWISEMYGYSFAAASVGVWHRQMNYAANIVPGNGPIGPPMVLHYGNDLSLNNTSYNFSKIAIRETGFDATLCPPWDLSNDRVAPGGLLPYPPSPLSLVSEGIDLLRDLLAIEPAIVLNAAFCERHRQKCGISLQLEEECAKVEQQERELDEAYDALEAELRKTECKDSVPDCVGWKAEGQCDNNPRYMHYGCRQSCGSCIQPDLQVRWHRNSEKPKSAGCHSQQADYDLDYDHSAFEALPDPCEGAAADDYDDDSEAEPSIDRTAEAEKDAEDAGKLSIVEELGGDRPAAGRPIQVSAPAPAEGSVLAEQNVTSTTAGLPTRDSAADSASAEDSLAEGVGILVPGDGISSYAGEVEILDGGVADLEAGSGEVANEVQEQKQPAVVDESMEPLDNVPLSHLGLEPLVTAVQYPATPLSQRMRVSIRSARGGDAEETAAAVDSIHVLITVLDSVGVVSIWCCVVALFLMLVRRPIGRHVSSQRSLTRPLVP